MAFITFIYRIGNSKHTFYGKYVCDYVSDDHEGLDLEVESALTHGINKYRTQKGQEPLSDAIRIGIMSYSANEIVPVYSSEKEIQWFDFYHENSGIPGTIDEGDRVGNCKKTKTYVNGELLPRI